MIDYRLYKLKEIINDLEYIGQIRHELLKWYKDIEASCPYENEDGDFGAKMFIKIFGGFTDEELEEELYE